MRAGAPLIYFWREGTPTEVIPVVPRGRSSNQKFNDGFASPSTFGSAKKQGRFGDWEDSDRTPSLANVGGGGSKFSPYVLETERPNNKVRVSGGVRVH